MDHISHVKNTGGLDNESVTEETVSEHCNKTALLARSYSALFNMESTVFVSALLHDLGKLNYDFDGYIKHKNGNAFDNKSNNWQRVVNCACGMIRKRIIETKGECTMSLEKECCDRDYLYGRLLAVADYAEGSTYDDNENRPTNAKRLMEAFSNHPCETWKVLCLSLRPYLNRMNIGKRSYFERMINQITAMFPLDTYNDNSPLSSEFLHAYSCQMNDFFTKKTDDNKEEE